MLSPSSYLCLCSTSSFHSSWSPFHLQLALPNCCCWGLMHVWQAGRATEYLKVWQSEGFSLLWGREKGCPEFKRGWAKIFYWTIEIFIKTTEVWNTPKYSLSRLLSHNVSDTNCMWTCNEYVFFNILWFIIVTDLGGWEPMTVMKQHLAGR